MWRLLFPILLLSLTTSAMDPPALLWEREYFSDRQATFYHAIQTSDDGFAVAAYVQGFTAGNRPVIKLNSVGDILWYAGNTFYTQGCRWIEQLPDSGYIATGSAIVEAGDPVGVYLLRVGKNGSIIWTKIYTPSTNRDVGYCVTPLPDGGFAVCGEYDEYDAFVMRTDASGDSLWTRVFDLSGAQRAFRVIYWDNALTVFQWAGMGPRILRYSMDGDLLWDQYWPGTFPIQSGYWGGDMCLASNGGYVFCTGYQSLIAQTDWEGNLIWHVPIPGGSEREGLSVNPTMDGGYIFSGWEGVFGYPEDTHAPELIEYSPPVDTGWTQDGWLVKLDSLGNSEWHINNELADRHNIFYCARQLQGGGYIVSGRRGIHAYLLRYAPETGIEEGSILPVQPCSINPLQTPSHPP